MRRRRVRPVRLLFWLAVIVGCVWLVQRYQRRGVAAPAAPSAPETEVRAPVAAWVEPEADGSCPASHPIKAKLKSQLFHLPGMAAYDRTKPDRCYRDEAAAEADGLRKAKR